MRAVAPADLVRMFGDAGLPIAPLSGGVEEFVRTSAASAQGGMLAGMRLAARELKPRIDAWTRETLAACDGVDVMTGGIGGMVVGLSVAEKLGKPFIPTHLQPVDAASDTYPGPLASALPRGPGGVGWRLSHRLSAVALRMPFQAAMASARTDVLGLSGRPTAADGQPILYGFSRHVVPVPETANPERLVTGYWWLPAPDAWDPPPALEAFLAAGGPLVSIGFGSMVSTDPAAMTDLVVGAVRRAGVRAVILSGWGGLATLPPSDDIFVAESVPHDWLFPRVRAIVHHGGAGTTGAAVRAGVPAVVVPFGVDQPFWASRVRALGIGTTPIPRRRLSEERLAGALAQVVTDEAMRRRAAVLGAQVRAEDGVGEAVRRFGRLAPS